MRKVLRLTRLARKGLALGLGNALALLASAGLAAQVNTLPGIPPVVDLSNLYSEATAGHLSPAVAGDLSRVYVPNVRSNDVYVIDPDKMKVAERFAVGREPQHVVPVLGPEDVVGH
jgi:YVTN family beta-propeller protein